MEKVIVVNCSTCLSDRDVQEVNDLLDSGWSVKHVKMTSNSDWLTAIFVLEKK